MGNMINIGVRSFACNACARLCCNNLLIQGKTARRNQSLEGREVTIGQVDQARNRASYSSLNGEPDGSLDCSVVRPVLPRQARHDDVVSVDASQHVGVVVAGYAWLW